MFTDPNQRAYTRWRIRAVHRFSSDRCGLPVSVAQAEVIQLLAGSPYAHSGPRSLNVGSNRTLAVVPRSDSPKCPSNRTMPALETLTCEDLPPTQPICANSVTLRGVNRTASDIRSPDDIVIPPKVFADLTKSEPCLADGRRRLWPLPANGTEIICGGTSSEPDPIPTTFASLAVYYGGAATAGTHAKRNGTATHSDILTRYGGNNVTFEQLSNATLYNPNAVLAMSSRMSSRDLLQLFQSTSFCLCVDGHPSESLAHQVFRAIWATCLPAVVFSGAADWSLLPFASFLDWSRLTIPLTATDVPRLPKVLGAVPISASRSKRALIAKARALVSSGEYVPGHTATDLFMFQVAMAGGYL